MAHRSKRSSAVGYAFLGESRPGTQERKCIVLITAAHLRALHELATCEAAGHTVRTLTEHEEPQEYIHRELELQGFMVLEPPRSYRLTYAGREALGLLKAM